MEIEKQIVLDILDVKAPALSATSDMPVVETKPDSLPEPAEPPKPEEDGEAEQLEESATSTTETPGQPTDKAPRGVGKKIAELVKQREDERRRADSEHEEKLRLLALLEGTKKPPEDTPVKPVRSDFSDPEKWDEALMAYAEAKASWAAKKEVTAMLAEETEKSREAAAAEGQRIVREAYQKRIETTKEKYADFDEVANSPDVLVSMPVAHAIIQSDNGPEIQYYLGKHPEEAERLSKMTVSQFNHQTRSVETVPDVARQLLELGLIVGKINTPQPKPPISNAPKPLKPLKSADSGHVKELQDMTMDEYAKARRSH